MRCSHDRYPCRMRAQAPGLTRTRHTPSPAPDTRLYSLVLLVNHNIARRNVSMREHGALRLRLGLKRSLWPVYHTPGLKPVKSTSGTGTSVYLKTSRIASASADRNPKPDLATQEESHSSTSLPICLSSTVTIYESKMVRMISDDPV